MIVPGAGFILFSQAEEGEEEVHCGGDCSGTLTLTQYNCSWVGFASSSEFPETWEVCESHTLPWGALTIFSGAYPNSTVGDFENCFPTCVRFNGAYSATHAPTTLLLNIYDSLGNVVGTGGLNAPIALTYMGSSVIDNISQTPLIPYEEWNGDRRITLTLTSIEWSFGTAVDDPDGGGDAIWYLTDSYGYVHEDVLPFELYQTWAYGQFFGNLLTPLEPPYPTSMTLVGSSDIMGTLRFYYGNAGAYPGTLIEVDWGETVALGSFGTSGAISFENPFSGSGSDPTGTVTLTAIIFHYS